MNTKTNQNINLGVDTGNFQLDIYIRTLTFTLRFKMMVNTLGKFLLVVR